MFDERAKLINSKNYNDISEIENQLSLLGVSKIDASEIQAKYGEDLIVTSTNTFSNTNTVDWFTTTQEYRF